MGDSVFVGDSVFLRDSVLETVFGRQCLGDSVFLGDIVTFGRYKETPTGVSLCALHASMAHKETPTGASLRSNENLL